jgi:hypothetical protein
MGTTGPRERQTSLGERAGFWRRRFPGDLVQALARSASGPVISSLPPFARVSGGARVLASELSERNVRLLGGEVGYEVLVSICWCRSWSYCCSLSVGPVAARAYAARVVKGEAEPADKVHRLRVVVTSIALIAPSCFPPCCWE